MSDKGFRDDYCEACHKEVANHETDAGILCDKCFKEVYPEESMNELNRELTQAIKDLLIHPAIQGTHYEARLRQLVKKGEMK